MYVECDARYGENKSHDRPEEHGQHECHSGGSVDAVPLDPVSDGVEQIGDHEAGEERPDDGARAVEEQQHGGRDHQPAPWHVRQR